MGLISPKFTRLRDRRVQVRSTGNASADLGWQRFLLGGAPDHDTHTQHASLVETDAYTQTTSPGSVTITTANDHDHMQQGSIWGPRALKDANGVAITWDKPFSMEWLLECKNTSGAYTKFYFGLGVTDEATASDIPAARIIGTAINHTHAAKNKVRGFGCGGYGQSGDSGDHDWSAHTVLIAGPGHEHIGQQISVRANQFDPASQGVEASNMASSYICNLGNSCVIEGQGPVYIFATTGFIGSRASAYTHKFRIWYRVSGGGAEWAPA